MRLKQVFKLCFSAMFLLICSLSFQANAQAPRINPNDLVINGESFYAMGNFSSELSRLARADGVLGPNENFKMIAQSGKNISEILGFYKECNPKPTYLVTTGGGIDLMGSCGGNPSPSCPLIRKTLETLQAYMDEMKKGGTKKFTYLSYPDVFGFGEGNLKNNIPFYNPEAEKLVKASTDPICTWVDLYTIWKGKERQYSSDGNHMSEQGATVSAQAFWDAMKADNWAFFDTGATSIPKKAANNHNTAPLQILGQIIKNGKLSVSLSIDQPSNITIQLTTVSGRSVFSTQSYAAKSGKQTIALPAGELAKGIYCCEVRAGKLSSQSTVFVP